MDLTATRWTHHGAEADDPRKSQRPDPDGCDGGTLFPCCDRTIKDEQLMAEPGVGKAMDQHPQGGHAIKAT